MTDIDYMIATMQAAKEGKAIQSRSRTHSNIDENWSDVTSPLWNWDERDYRVKPAPPRRVWVNWYPTMNCRSLICYDSREEAESMTRYAINEQIEFVEVEK